MSLGRSPRAVGQRACAISWTRSPARRRCSSAIPPPRGTPQVRIRIALLTGPEGGWTDAERAAATAAGWTPVSLGPLILRAETAAIAAAAILTHAWWASQLE